MLYEEPELTVRVVRDLFNDEEFTEIVTDSVPVYDMVRAYLQRGLFSAELTLAEARGTEYQSLVQLYRALGGGWQQ